MSRNAPSTDLTTTAPVAGTLATLGDSGDLRGKEHFDTDDVTFPRIALAQKTSPQLEKNKPEYIPGLTLYDMFNSLTGEIYGEGPVQFAVIRTAKRAMEFDKGNRVVRFHVPLNDPSLDFTTGPNGERVKPTATLFRDYLVLLVPSLELAVLSLKGTQHGVAKRLNGLMTARRGAAWMGLYTLTAGSKAHGDFTTGQYIINPAGPTPPDAVAVAETWYEKSAGFAEHVDREAPGSVQTPDEDGIPF